MMASTVAQGLAGLTFLGVLYASQGLACTFHQTNVGGFAVTYPGSLQVAAAVAKARSKERLTAKQLHGGVAGYWAVSRLLKDFGDRFDLVPETSMTGFYVILAGQQLWTKYSVEEYADGKAYNVYVHTAAPSGDTPVVVTSYYVIKALHDGALTMDEASETGLVQVRGDKSGRVADAFREALSVEYAAR